MFNRLADSSIAFFSAEVTRASVSQLFACFWRPIPHHVKLYKMQTQLPMFRPKDAGMQSCKPANDVSRICAAAYMLLAGMRLSAK